MNKLSIKDELKGLWFAILWHAYIFTQKTL